MGASKLQKILFIPDVHAPYHDQRAWNILLAAAKKIRPDIVVVLGDFLDCYAVSSHSRNPKLRLGFKEEVDTARAMLAQLQKLRAKKYIFLAGNHEDRIERYVRDTCPELFELVSTPSILRLEKWTYVPYRKFAKIGKLYVTHDVGSAGKYAHYTVSDVFQRNVISAHTHRMAMVVQSTVEGKAHMSASFGWLGDRNAIEYMAAAKVTKDWSLGFGVAHVDSSTGFAYITAIPIVNYTCLVDGKLVGEGGEK